MAFPLLCSVNVYFNYILLLIIRRKCCFVTVRSRFFESIVRIL
ncbi:hypothetical protein HMPREF9442_01629 [Paraprevotella xylaniphila YIT 11841]|uniref:Uncharacterized protein n=1 Tax=Paraprevotella xylaniphila YIT 11841 TaxID=762982 RepID=F3QTV9_9BACT|nr:hypothetical protein HMPREF9442_01629 [Paraprevotella xylaniphila YIT 11841]